ncbi:class II fructose-bisphosphatase [Bacillus sp. REN16]|uniref:class II fructose-bisphosphatase n=1 Tax=Bacillus sp. REN16 TaxID=2887296 RepID=UPI001E4D6554|nr:class II fructose-bisphosphatase [Bacillus sp. REN16]MCC3355918.1 class II fructose-bisphosphatase [Bacillus sp. REN16]
MLTNTEGKQELSILQLTGEFLKVTQKAALASYPWIGRKSKLKADNAGTQAMRVLMNQIFMDAVVVIGEGEMDEAPMLYIGEKLGKGVGPAIDIAVDPVEGTTLMSNGEENSLSVLAVAKRGSLLHAPDMYMEKIAVGPEAKGKIDINAPISENIQAVAKAKGKRVEDITVMIQDRPRHENLIKQVIQVGGKIRLFQDVDITGAVATAIDDLRIDMLVGTGGAPEGVISAVALKCLGGDFQAKLVPQNTEEIERCLQMGIKNPGVALSLDEIVTTDYCFFVATGITDGLFLKGVRKIKETMLTHSFLAIGGEVKNSQFIETSHFNMY